MLCFARTQATIPLTLLTPACPVAAADDAQHSCDDSECDEDGDSGSEDEGRDEQQQQPHQHQQHARARSHAGAAAGPGSSAASGPGTSSRKRTPAQAGLQDAIALLPAELDEEQLVRLRRKLPLRNATAKRALLQRYRQQFPHWRFLLRHACWWGGCVSCGRVMQCGKLQQVAHTAPRCM
jgi:hypothetical protein